MTNAAKSLKEYRKSENTMTSNESFPAQTTQAGSKITMKMVIDFVCSKATSVSTSVDEHLSRTRAYFELLKEAIQ